MDDFLLSTVRQAGRQLAAELARIEPLAAGQADAPRCYESMVTAIDGCLDRLRQLGVWGAANRLPSSELWNAAGAFLSRGWLQNRARTKPRGYAGDYELLAAIYEQRCCDDPLGRLMDRYFLDQAAPRAVANRMAMIADWLVALSAQEGERRMAIVGSAFGLEVAGSLGRLSVHARARLHITLLDLDPAAIEFARRCLAPLLPADRLTAECVNLFRLPARPASAALLSGSELVVCPGLFDYLDDSAAIAMLQTLYAQLAPGGRLIVFQFAPHTPTRAYMEWVANWYLLYRDAGALRSLAEEAGIAANRVTIGSEPLGVDLFLEISGRG